METPEIDYTTIKQICKEIRAIARHPEIDSSYFPELFTSFVMHKHRRSLLMWMINVFAIFTFIIASFYDRPETRFMSGIVVAIVACIAATHLLLVKKYAVPSFSIVCNVCMLISLVLETEGRFVSALLTSVVAYIMLTILVCSTILYDEENMTTWGNYKEIRRDIEFVLDPDSYGWRYYTKCACPCHNYNKDACVRLYNLFIILNRAMTGNHVPFSKRIGLYLKMVGPCSTLAVITHQLVYVNTWLTCALLLRSNPENIVYIAIGSVMTVCSMIPILGSSRVKFSTITIDMAQTIMLLIKLNPVVGMFINLYVLHLSVFAAFVYIPSRKTQENAHQIVHDRVKLLLYPDTSAGQS